MDGVAQNEVSQGNSMLSDMREHNREVLRHNLVTKASYDSQILNARKTAREGASEKKAETMGAGLGEGGTQALKIAKQVHTAYGKVAGGIGYQGMGRAEVAGRTAVQVLKDAPVGQAVSKAAGAASDVAEAAKPAVSAVARRGLLGTGAQTAQRGADLEVSHALTTAPARVSTIAGPKTQGLGVKTALKTDAPKVEGAFGKGIDFAEKGGALLNIASGGMDAIEDAVAGHVMGHNKDSKAGNELGIAGGVASLAGFAVPGLGLIGAGLGIASGVESMIGSQKQSAKEIGTTLPAQEKAEEEKTVSYSGATGESQGQLTQKASVPTATGGAGASAF
jgi:hypothetical protein